MSRSHITKPPREKECHISRTLGRKHFAHVAMNSAAPPTMIRSVAATSRSLCVLVPPHRAQMPVL
jgi:hypothetical protein